MCKIYLTADVLEINRYRFTVDVDNKLPATEAFELAKIKLKTFLDTNCPNPYQNDNIDGITCLDRETAISTETVQSIDINMPETIVNF